MKEKDDDIAHPGTVSKPKKHLILAQFSNSPWTGRLPVCSANATFPRAIFRGCRHFVMFRPPSLLASPIAPTTASFPTGQPRLLHPGISCFVASARSGYAIRPHRQLTEKGLSPFKICSLVGCSSASLALPTAGSTLPSADFCDTIKVNRFTFSHECVTCRRSPEVSLTAFDAQPPDLQPVPLMDMDFAVVCSLVRHRMPQI